MRHRSRAHMRQARLLLRRDLDLDLVGNGPSHLALQGENISQVARLGLQRLKTKD